MLMQPLSPRVSLVIYLFHVDIHSFKRLTIQKLYKIHLKFKKKTHLSIFFEKWHAHRRGLIQSKFLRASGFNSQRYLWISHNFHYRFRTRYKTIKGKDETRRERVETLTQQHILHPFYSISSNFLFFTRFASRLSFLVSIKYAKSPAESWRPLSLPNAVIYELWML